jgi:hypothetical protein
MTRNTDGVQAPDKHPNGVMVSGSAVIVPPGTEGVVSIRLDGSHGRITVARTGSGGEIRVLDNADNASIWLLGTSGTFVGAGNLLLGTGLSGGVRTIELRGNTGEMSVYHFLGPGTGTKRALHFEAQTSRLTIGMEHMGGQVFLQSPFNATTVRLESSPAARLVLGGVGTPGQVIVHNNAGEEQVRIDGISGDILLRNADCAEHMAAASDCDIDPGTVVVLEDDALVHPCSEAYDQSVVGVVSGGKGRGAGIILGHGQAGGYTVPVALVGKVYCKASAEYDPIRTGDLLATSPTSGHAMLASDRTRHSGAILGKALRPLTSGTELIPILVMMR